MLAASHRCTLHFPQHRRGGERIALQGLYQTRTNAPDAATPIPPVCLPSTKDSFMACRHYATNSSDLKSGISLPQVSVMFTMQTQALFAVLRDFDLADLRRGLSVDGRIPPGKVGFALP